MDWRAFSELWTEHTPSQQKYEYFLFLRFVEFHFQMKGITKPIIVEIGVKNIEQSKFYTKFFDAEYIGIDIAPKNSESIIMGDSKSASTIRELKRRLNGRLINLCFIDGDHLYAAVKIDWELYRPLTKNLIAFHDINWMRDAGTHRVDGPDLPSVRKLWDELYNNNESLVSLQCPGTKFVASADGRSLKRYYETPGIGIVILDRDVIENRDVVTEKVFKAWYGESGEKFPLAPFHYNGGLK